MNYNSLNSTYWSLVRTAALFALLCAGAVESDASSSMKLEWNANTEADIRGYRVHVGTSSGIYTSTVDAGNATSTVISDLVAGETYFFIVTAYDIALQESGPSEEISITVPFPSLVFGGTFTGAVVPSDAGTNAFAELSMTKTRQFTGRILIGNLSTAIAGTVSATGRASLIPALPLPQDWRFIFQLNPGGTSMTVRLIRGTTNVEIYLESTAYSTESKTPHAGAYTARLGPMAADTSSLNPIPGRGGFARMVVTPAGRTRTAGRLVDGAAFSCATFLGGNGKILVHSPLYNNANGILAGSLFLRETAAISDGDGTLRWRRPALAVAALFTDGFNGTVPVEISRFQKYTTLQAASAGNTEPAMALLESGDLPGKEGMISRMLAFPRGNSVSVPGGGGEKLTIQIRPSTGLISGSFTHPADGKTRSLSGVVFQKQNKGSGFFRGIRNLGQFDLIGLPVP